jgi:hypothetical protein
LWRCIVGEALRLQREQPAAHALGICDGGSVHDIDIAVLQERLKDNLEPTI